MKILQGDTDAMSLMGTSQDHLLHGPTHIPPTAIKLQYYWYTFTPAYAGMAAGGGNTGADVRKVGTNGGTAGSDSGTDAVC